MTANNKVYDGTTAARLTTNNVVLSGVVAGDAANVVLTTNGYVANFASANVSNNVPVTVSGLSLARECVGELHVEPADEPDGEYHGQGCNNHFGHDGQQQGV